MEGLEILAEIETLYELAEKKTTEILELQDWEWLHRCLHFCPKQLLPLSPQHLKKS